MPDEAAATAETEPAKQEEAKPTEPAKEPEAKKDAPLGEAGEKALEAWKQRAKEAEAKAKDAETKAQEYEDRDKSELERANNKLQRAEKAKADAEAKLLRYEIAAEKDVPSKLVPLLTGSSREELETQADLILENAKPAEKTPEFDGGVRTPAPEPKSPEEAHQDTLLQVLGLTPNQT